MCLIDQPNDRTLAIIARMHWEAYHEKFTSGISEVFEDYKQSTLEDCGVRKCLVTIDFSGLIVLEDMTDKLLLNSTYHLVRRIYVKPDYRGRGIAKRMVKYCQDRYGTLMGWDGKFYTLKEE